ncbi:PHC2 protein, partial [Zapornia atra]|nr:PHC2 protein [Zapornia atra]
TPPLPSKHPWVLQCLTLGSSPQASLAANRQSASSGGNGAQPTPAQQPTINLATSPAQLLNRAQSVTPGASGIAQQAVLLGNAASPALTASQAQMYLRAQMV